MYAAPPDGEPPEAAAAALVGLFEEDGEARVVLIRRATGLSLNPGEMAFPGGKVERGEGMVAAALREAHEEVGLDPADVEVVGWLDRVTGRKSGSVVLPVIGLLGGRPSLVPAAAEVDAVTDVALSALLTRCRTEWWDERHMYFFDLGEDTGAPGAQSDTGAAGAQSDTAPGAQTDTGAAGAETDIVWGLTARVLYQLLCRVTGQTAPPAPVPAPGRGGTRPPAPS